MKIKKGTILNIIRQEYKKYQYLINQSENQIEVKMLLLAKRDAISAVMDKIEEKEIELNGGINYN